MVAQNCGTPYFLFEPLYLAPLTIPEIELILAPPSASHAVALSLLSEGMPAILQALLTHWRRLGEARQTDDGRWQIERLSHDSFPGQLYDELILAPLEESSERASALGYDLSVENLLAWLNHAVWEGDLFSDQVLAQAVLGDQVKALAYYEQALPLRRQVGNRWNECDTLGHMARTYENLGDLAQTEAHFEAAVRVAEAVKRPDLQVFRTELERVRRLRAG